VSGVLAAIAGFLVEPVASAEPSSGAMTPGAEFTTGQAASAWTRAARPAVAVAGLAPRCGATTVGRALAAELALRDSGGAAVVSADAIAGGGVPLGTAPASRLARALPRSLPVETRATGRICLAAPGASELAALVELSRELAPLVLDVPDPSQIASAASLVDAVVLVGLPRVEPALAGVLAESLRRVGPEPIVVVNRARDEADRWAERCALTLPDSRVGARLALAGREPRGDLGRAVARLADLVSGG
jgi:hypothetical protein